MAVTLIYAHPYPKSFNRAILDAMRGELAARNEEFYVIDLYADNFNPVMTEEELAAYTRGEYKDPAVAHYNEILDKTDKLALIFPIWWYDFPAILKGFFDKVMLPGSGYTSTPEGLKAVRDIPETLVVTTSSASTAALVEKLGDAVNRVMIETTFRAVGLNGARWENFGEIGKSTEKSRKEFLEHLRKLI